MSPQTSRPRHSLLRELLPFAAAWTGIVTLLLAAWWHSEYRHLGRLALARAETAFRLQAAYHMAMMEARRVDPSPRGGVVPRGMLRNYLWHAMDHGEISGRLVAPGSASAAPDPWEERALASLAEGGEQVSETLREGDRAVLRFVGALRQEPGCLECHPGTKVGRGGVMGGISLAMPAPSGGGVLADPSRRWMLGSILLGWASVLAGAVWVRRRQRRAAAQAERNAASLRTSEARLREAQQVAHMGSFEHDHRTGQIVWSEETYRIFGRDPAHTPPTYDVFMEHVHPEDRVRVAEEYNRHLAEHCPYQAEYRVVREDGEIRILLVSCRTEFDAAGNPQRTLGVNVDLTEQRRLDAALKAQAEAHRVLLETSIDGCLEVDEAGRVVRVNDAYLRLSGFGRDQVLGRRARDLEATEDSGAVLAQASRVRKLGMARYETWHRGAEGRRIPLQVSVTHLPSQGRFLYFLRDLTAEREARRALAESEARFADAFRMSPDAIILSDLATGTILDCNAGFEILSGWTREEAVGRRSLDLGVWVDPEARGALIAEVQARREASPVRLHLRRKDGVQGRCEVRSVLIGSDPAGRVLTVVRDVTDLERAEASMRASEARFRAIFDQAAIGMALLDGERRIRLANSSLTAFLHRREGELLGLEFLSCLVPAEEGCPPADPQGGGPIAGEGLLLRPDGSRVWGRWRISPIRAAEDAPSGHLGLVEDITETRQREAVSLESEAILAKGQMAAYVAHEINGPLAGISSALQLIQAAVPEDHPRRNYLDLARQEVQRIAGIVRSLYELHQVPHGGGGGPQDAAVGDVMQEVASLMSARFRASRVTLQLDPGEPGLRVALRSDLLRQVLFNLLLNALDASPEEGLVHCSTARVEGGLELRVADQGRGIPEDIRERIWEPGFTTKRNAVQGGLGMGLSTTRRLLESIQGSIRFEPRTPGPGTVFVARVPLILKPQPAGTDDPE